MGWFTVITTLLNFLRTEDLYVTSQNIGMFIFCGFYWSRSWENMNLLIGTALMCWFDHICYFWVQRSDFRESLWFFSSLLGVGHDSLASSGLRKGADLPRGPIPEASAKLRGRNTIFKNGILIACTAEGLLKLAGLISPGNPFPPFQ